MDRADYLKQWEAAQTAGLWCAPWSKALEGLTAKDASWKPQPQRHSIWQIVNHVAYWRQVGATRAGGGPSPSEQDSQRRNFEEPAEVSDSAWRKTQDSFLRSHNAVRDAIQSEKHSMDVLMNILPHDQYHLGQVMLVRAMLGKPPVE